jgi:hypothetical protein
MSRLLPGSTLSAQRRSIAGVDALASELRVVPGVLIIREDPAVVHITCRDHPLIVEYSDQPWVLEDSAALSRSLGDDAPGLPEDVMRYRTWCDRRIAVSYTPGTPDSGDALERVMAAIL